jgi:hypothetical protein
MAYLGLDCLTHLSVSNGYFDSVLIVVDHVIQMAHFLPCTESVTTEEIVNLFYVESTNCTDYLECWSLITTRNCSEACGKRFDDALERGSTYLLVDTRTRIN